MIYHIIDHQGFGTIHKLLIPLCRNNEQHKLIIYNDEKSLNQIKNEDNCSIVIHSTASRKSNFLYNFLNYFNDKKVYIFMHVSANYQLYKKRQDVLDYLKKLTEEYNITVLTPATEVTQQYLNYGINSKTIQLGLDYSDIDLEYNPNLSLYYNKIITTCSSDNDVYKFIKGIDIYERFITKNGLEKYSLVAGTDNSNNTQVLCKKFDEKDFINILAHSTMYVQFSRFESYNLTASYAKILRIPVLLLNSEGNYSCMRGNVYDNYSLLEKDALSILKGNKNEELINNLYNDSINRESIYNFGNELEKTVRGNEYEFTKKRI